MYAIVEIAGQQFKAEKGRKLYVHRLPQPEGSAVSCRQVMLLEKDGKVRVGAPIIEDAAVEVEILRHLKDDKVIVFKKNRRKGYRVKNGHRQCLTQILVSDIVEGKAPAAKVEKAAPAPKAAAPKAEKPVAATVEVAPKVEKPVAAPKAEKPAAAPKAAKPAAPKATAEKAPAAKKTTTEAAKKPAAPKTKKSE